jgi:hypothetical protein
MRLEFFLAGDLAHRALNQVGKTFVPGLLGHDLHLHISYEPSMNISPTDLP